MMRIAAVRNFPNFPKVLLSCIKPFLSKGIGKRAIVLPLHCLAVMLSSAVAFAADNPVPNPYNAYSKQPLMVIVIDDLGNNLERGRRAIELPGSLTYGILPHTPLAKKLAFYTTRFNERKEVIIHMPMQAKSPRRLGPGALELSQDRESFASNIQGAVDAIPYARGLSNHMGSGLTSLPDRMRWLMAELSRHNFYFIDSRTTSMSTAAFVANQKAIPHLARDVFLDHDINPASIDRAFKRSVALARQNGLAVVIAHPYEETLTYLEQALPQLHDHGITLVTASEAIARKEQLAANNTSPAQQDKIVTRSN